MAEETGHGGALVHGKNHTLLQTLDACCCAILYRPMICKRLFAACARYENFLIPGMSTCTGVMPGEVACATSRNHWPVAEWLVAVLVLPRGGRQPGMSRCGRFEDAGLARLARRVNCRRCRGFCLFGMSRWRVAAINELGCCR